MARRKTTMSLEVFVVVNTGLSRVRNLVDLHDQLSEMVDDSTETQRSDVLRAATVLLHAVLEEFVRYVAARVLPLSSAERLSSISLPGFPRGSKFTLGDLVAHRGITIDALISRSVEDDLRKRSFSSLAQVLGVLRDGGIQLRERRVPAKTLQRLMERRHRIVHEADEVPERRPADHAPRAISRRQVNAWIRAVEQFVREVDRAWKDRR
jgi:hypothetical protein